MTKRATPFCLTPVAGHSTILVTKGWKVCGREVSAWVTWEAGRQAGSSTWNSEGLFVFLVTIRNLEQDILGSFGLVSLHVNAQYHMSISGLVVWSWTLKQKIILRNPKKSIQESIIINDRTKKNSRCILTSATNASNSEAQWSPPAPQSPPNREVQKMSLGLAVSSPKAQGFSISCYRVSFLAAQRSVLLRTTSRRSANCHSVRAALQLRSASVHVKSANCGQIVVIFIASSPNLYRILS